MRLGFTKSRSNTLSACPSLATIRTKYVTAITNSFYFIILHRAYCTNTHSRCIMGLSCKAIPVLIFSIDWKCFMTVTSVELDLDRQQKAKEYARIRRRLSYITIAIGVIGIFILLFTNLGTWLGDQLQALSWQPVAGWFPIQILVYFLILMLAYEIITAPIAYYSGFVLLHRYGLSTMSLKSWLGDLFKGLALSLVLEILVIEFVYLLLAIQPPPWWLYVTMAMLFFSVVVAYLTPELIFHIFYKFTPLPEGDLTKRLLALAARAYTRVRGVFTMHMSNNSTTANGAPTGLGNTRRIVIGDTMLDRYTPDEIEVVLAHELGHHVNHDIW